MTGTMETTTTKRVHTSGPWTTGTLFIWTGETIITGADGSLVCAFRRSWRPGEHALETDQANARLIAASPDLLEACEALCEAVAGHEARTGCAQMHPAIEKARIAIVKALEG